jgi:hypothetical protein
MPHVQALATGHDVPMDVPVVQVPVKPVRTSTLLDAPHA